MATPLLSSPSSTPFILAAHKNVQQHYSCCHHHHQFHQQQNHKYFFVVVCYCCCCCCKISSFSFSVFFFLFHLSYFLMSTKLLIYKNVNKRISDIISYVRGGIQNWTVIYDSGIINLGYGRIIMSYPVFRKCQDKSQKLMEGLKLLPMNHMMMVQVDLDNIHLKFITLAIKFLVS